MKNTMLDAAHGSISAAGAAANIAMMTGFAWATAHLWGVASEAFASAGGVPSLSVSHLQALATDPALPSMAAGYATAWFASVGAAGCAFMTALGIRWAYHALLRMTLKFRD